MTFTEVRASISCINAAVAILKYNQFLSGTMMKGSYCSCWGPALCQKCLFSVPCIFYHNMKLACKICLHLYHLHIIRQTWEMENRPIYMQKDLQYIYVQTHRGSFEINFHHCIENGSHFFKYSIKTIGDCKYNSAASTSYVETPIGFGSCIKIGG